MHKELYVQYAASNMQNLLELGIQKGGSWFMLEQEHGKVEHGLCNIQVQCNYQTLVGPCNVRCASVHNVDNVQYVLTRRSVCVR